MFTAPNIYNKGISK